MSYKCSSCKREVTTEDNIYSVMTTGLCVFHAHMNRIKKEDALTQVQELNTGLSGQEENLFVKMFLREKYGLQI